MGLADNETIVSSLATGQESIDLLDLCPDSSWQSRFTEDQYKRFLGMTAAYVSDIPESASREHVVGESSLVTLAESSHLSEHWVSKNAEASAVATTAGSVNRLKRRLQEKLAAEFKTCGIESIAPEQQEVSDRIIAHLESSLLNVSEKHGIYKGLMQHFVSNISWASSELRRRMPEKLLGFFDEVKGTPEMPSKPNSLKRFLSADARNNYDSWVRSQDFLLERLRLNLPGREILLDEYYKSADAAYRRMVYGFRSMDLTHGLSGDSTGEIDSYQRQYYEQLGGYKIALTPAEWLTQYNVDYLDDILYGTGPVSSMLDDAVKGSSYGESYRAVRKRKYMPKNETDPTQDGLQDDALDGIISEEYKRLEGLDDTQRKVFDDMQLLYDSNIPVLYAGKRSELEAAAQNRSKIMDACSKIILEMDIVGKGYVLGSDELRSRILRKLNVAFHPDRPEGDEELCKIVTNIAFDVRKKNKERASREQ